MRMIVYSTYLLYVSKVYTPAGTGRAPDDTVTHGVTIWSEPKDDGI